ncbi:MAG: penicillin-binding protein activator [Proteobacteria bacterium]|nr:penicillin-binding protein activator [Pseudomonadota bacterium]
MKSINLIIILLSIALLFSCTSKQVTSPGARHKDDPGYDIFQKAEKQFNSQSYEKALKIYQTYLENYPEGQMAPACILKIGSILSHEGNYKEARRQFDTLIKKYPANFFIPDARVEYLFTYYKEGSYQDVVDGADKMMEGLPASYQLRMNMLKGDAYMAMNLPVEALFSYIKTEIDLKSPEGKNATSRIKGAIALLDASDIISILHRVEDNRTLGFLMFQLGRNYADEGNAEDALKILSGFIAGFPNHENVPEAQQIIEEMNTRSRSANFIVGCLLPLSGPYKTFGEKALKGIEIALSNLEDLRVRSKIKLIIKDTGSDPELTVKAVRELNEENAVAIIGPITTPQAGAEEAQALKIPIIVLSQKSDLVDIGDYVFRNFITPEMQVKALAEYIFNELDLNRFAILYPDEKYGETFMNLFWDEVIQYGGKVVGVEPYNISHTDFSGPIKKLIGLYYPMSEDFMKTKGIARMKAGEEPEAIVDFDAIFIPEASAKAGLIVPQLSYNDITNVHLLGTNLWHSDVIIKMAKKEAQGAIIPEGFFQNSTLPHVRFFVDRFEETYGETPGFIEAISYDTASILFEIANYAYANAKEGVRKELLKVNHFKGITGDTSFKKNGDAEKELYILKIKGEQFVELEKHYKKFGLHP